MALIKNRKARLTGGDPELFEQAETGCEVVAADLNDKASLVAAFKGCHGAFLVTNFWEGLDVEREVNPNPIRYHSSLFCLERELPSVRWSGEPWRCVTYARMSTTCSQV